MGCKKPLLLLFFVLMAYVCRAAIYTVTSNADTGPGTLRDALTQAAASGGAATNYIYFNLPGADPASRTILVKSALPFITSSLVIDGTTQPGAALSVNGAGVIVQGIGQWPSNTNCFEVHDAADFEIYGMIVKEFYSINGAGSFTGGSALSLNGTSAKVIIGAANKGNVFYDVGTGVINFPLSQQTESNIAYCEVKNNYIGITEDGLTFPTSIQSTVVLSYTHQAVIGGNTAAEGNILVGDFVFSSYYDGVSLTAANNKFDINLGFFKNGVYSDQERFYINSNFVNSVLPSQVTVANNVLAGEITVTQFSNLNLTIQSNYFGTSPDRKITNAIEGPALNFSNVQGTILVGGTDTTKGNVFTQAVQDNVHEVAGDGVVQSQNSGTIELSHNSFYCNNNLPFVYLDIPRTSKPVFTTLDALTAGSATGTSKPGARVELFYSDKECTQCQPKSFIASVTADASGKWAYNGALLTGYGVIAAGTLNKISSEFTTPHLYMDSIVVQNETCTAMGSITGAIVTNGNQISWVGPNGPVNNGNNAQLTNAPAGIYQLNVNQFGCMVSSLTYTILDLRPLVNDNGKTITPATCGESNGAITGLVPKSNVNSVQWIDASGQVVGTKIDLTNVPAGVYTLQLIGPVCTNSYGPVIIGTKVNMILIAAGSAQIAPDDCGLNTGSIKGIKVSGGTPPYQYTWINSSGNTVSTSLDLTNLSSGNYILKVADGIICDSTSAVYVVEPSSNTIDAPVVTNIKVCGYDALLRVSNPAAGYRYRLYADATSTTPVDEEVSGVFKIKLSADLNYYYITQLIGTCESARTKAEADFSIELFKVTNAFTPNGDGINDYWDISGLDAYPAASVSIFNRYGQQLFHSVGYPTPFDGTYNGKQLPAGVYYYIINVGSACSLISGSLTLVR